MARRVLLAVLKALWWAFVLLTPLCGVWVASSLAVYRNGPLWLACLSGVLLFPVLPGAWEAFARHRFGKKARGREAAGNEAPKRFLTLGDRLILRTLALNLVFLTVLLAWFPRAGFSALSTRGDWMLGQQTGGWREGARNTLFAAAEGLEWLYEATDDDPFADQALEQDIPLPEPNDWEPAPDLSDDPAGDDSRGEETGAGGGDRPDQGGDHVDEPTPVSASRPWPSRDQLHPAVTTIPASEEESIASVAKYLAAQDDDPFGRVKALHDYVADRVAYDVPALTNGIPPQNAEKIFRERLGVCSGYARLLVALGEAVGIRVAYVVGDSRDADGEIGGGGHAWNAVEIEGRWYLLDATWNAGFVGDTFTKRYTSDYLFTPPQVFGIDHFPEEERWQLRREAISRGEFMRQPVLRPRFYKEGFQLIEPRRSQVTVDGNALLRIGNPRGHFLLARVGRRGASERHDCEVSAGAEIGVECELTSSGAWQVMLFSGQQRYGTYRGVGQVEVNRR